MKKPPFRILYCHTIISLAICLALLVLPGNSGSLTVADASAQAVSPRTRLLINEDWRFARGDPPDSKTSLAYDAVKAWVLPAGNAFLKDPDQRVKRPEGNPGNEAPYIAPDFDDSSWKEVNLPHDYAIEGLFTARVNFASWAYSPEKEFAAPDRYPFVGGEFVWTGWDYLGEPTPFNESRSSYFGIIDLAGFKKDRFYLYQSYWRPEHPMAHILPQWTWPDREGQVTPVHVYTSGDEAELFLNGKSLGRKKKAQFEYRLRWDDVVYEPGELRVVTYKDGQEWATDSVKTAGTAARLLLKADRSIIANDGRDLSYVTLTVADANGQAVPRSMNLIHFEVSGPGEIVATDNGDPTDMTAFPSKERKAFNGPALAIVRAKRGQSGQLTLIASSDGLEQAQTSIMSR